jgi:hypothetical protein
MNSKPSGQKVTLNSPGLLIALAATLLLIAPGTAAAFSGSGGIGPGKPGKQQTKPHPSGGVNISELSPASVKRFLRRSWRREINSAGRILRTSSERFSGALLANPGVRKELTSAGRCLWIAAEDYPAAVFESNDYLRFLSLGLLNAERISDQQFGALNQAERRRLLRQQRRAKSPAIKRLWAANARALSPNNSIPEIDYCQLVQEWVDNDYRQAPAIIDRAISRQQFNKSLRRAYRISRQQQRSYQWGQKYSRRAAALLTDPRQAIWDRFLDSALAG